VSSKVLFVDDDANITAAMARSFEAEPFDIVRAHSAQEGLDILARSTIDVVVSDEQMPGMAGSEFLAEIRKQYPNTIRMILTGEASIESAIRAINEGEVYRFFTKPCNPADLAVTIRQALQHKQLVEKSRRLLHEYQKQSSIIEELERSSPGITRLRTDEEGAILISNADIDVELDELLKDIEGCL